MIQDTFVVPAVSCGHCKGAVEGAVGRLAGVHAVVVDVPGKRVIVSYDAADVDQGAVVAAIEAAGYDVATVRRPAGGCCG